MKRSQDFHTNIILYCTGCFIGRILSSDIQPGSYTNHLHKIQISVSMIRFKKRTIQRFTRFNKSLKNSKG